MQDRSIPAFKSFPNPLWIFPKVLLSVKTRVCEKKFKFSVYDRWYSIAFKNSYSELCYLFDKGPEIILTAEEKHAYRQFFLAADEENNGVITGQNAVKFFGKSKLEPSALSKVCISYSKCDCKFNTTFKEVICYI